MKLFGAALVTLGLGYMAVSCRATNTSSDLESASTAGHPTMGMPIYLKNVAEVSGATAKEIFNNMRAANETKDSAGNVTKLVYGRQRIECSHDGIPPGAKGMVGPTKFSCTAQRLMPPGAQGFPPPAFMHIEGMSAQDFELALKSIKSEYDKASGLYKKSAILENGNFECQRSAPGGALPPGAQGMPAKESFGCRLTNR